MRLAQKLLHGEGGGSRQAGTQAGSASPFLGPPGACRKVGVTPSRALACHTLPFSTVARPGTSHSARAIPLGAERLDHPSVDNDLSPHTLDTVVTTVAARGSGLERGENWVSTYALFGITALSVRLSCLPPICSSQRRLTHM